MDFFYGDARGLLLHSDSVVRNSFSTVGEKGFEPSVAPELRMRKPRSNRTNSAVKYLPRIFSRYRDIERSTHQLSRDIFFSKCRTKSALHRTCRLIDGKGLSFAEYSCGIAWKKKNEYKRAFPRLIQTRLFTGILINH